MLPRLLRRPRGLDRALGYFGAWLVLGGGIVYLLLAPGEGRQLQAAGLAALLALLFAFIGLAAYYPCRATPLVGAGALRLVLTHALAALFSSSLWVLVGQLAVRAQTALGPDELARLFTARRPALLALGVLFYLLAAALHYVLLALEERELARRRELKLTVAAREAELAALRAQVNPHFLFNTLNSLASLCGSDPKAARAMSIALADFLRASLEIGREKRVPLEREIELAHSYVALERFRFGERLGFEVVMALEAQGVSVPALLLQPLVENAVRHGVASLTEGGTIELKAERKGAQLQVTVTNPYDPGRPATGKRTGFGLAGAEERLRLAYGRSARCVKRGDGGIFAVEIILPIEGADADPAG
ncbi:MAG TPA: histidine kinase [Thermoanaerobaculia bacterium]|nr:histidine kinase [Thermoanaerobaculia bacterium]